MIHELALFAGVGGGILGTHHILGWRTVCAVERDPFAREVLLRRQRDGLLPLFPIWDDVRTFDPRPWLGKVDIVTAGFPCQAFSTASRGRIVETNYWSEVERIATALGAHIFAENVLSKAFPSVGNIARASAASVGAPHIRRRWWLLAHPNCDLEPSCPLYAGQSSLEPSVKAYPWEPETISGVLGMADGVADRMVRFEAIGNGQVPLVAAVAFTELNKLYQLQRQRRKA